MSEASRLPIKKKVKQFISSILSLLVHVPFILLIGYGWWLFSQWYFNHIPALGVDLYNTATYASYLHDNFVSYLNGWKYIWWSGHPLIGEYPLLHFYFIAPLVGYLGTIGATQAYMLGTNLAFFLFCYFLFFQISRHRGLSCLMTVLTQFSIGIYGALVWGGSLPYFGTQLFFPAAILFFVRYLQSKNNRELLVSAGLTGLSLYGHPQIGIVYIAPTIVLLLVSWKDRALSLFDSRKIRIFSLFFLVTLFVGYLEMYGRIGVELIFIPFWILAYLLRFFGGQVSSFFPSGAELVVGESGTSGGDAAASATAVAMKALERSRFFHLFRDVHDLFLYLFVVVVVTMVLLLVTKSRKKLFRTLTYSLPLIYYILYIFAYSRGISFFAGGWYRVFWPFPIYLGMVVAWQWRAFSGWLDKVSVKVVSRIVNILVMIISVGLAVYVLIISPEPFFQTLDTKELALTESSSAYPLPLNYFFTKDGHEKIRDSLFPDWLDPNNRENRMYEADAQVTIWWNSFFKMPLQRGYIDPPIGTERRGGYFWLDIALTKDQLVNSFDSSVEIARNNTLFLLDWFGIRYIETGHAGTSYMPLSTYIDKAQYFKNEEEIHFTDQDSLMSYYFGKAEIPLRAVHVPKILYVGKFESYEAMRYALSKNPGNIANTQHFYLFINQDGAFNPDDPQVMVYYGLADITNVSKGLLEEYDGLILGDYSYEDYALSERDRAFQVIGDYVSQGKPLLIDSGASEFDGQSTKKGVSFPDFYPIAATKLEEVGTSWNFEAMADFDSEGVNFDTFSEPKEVKEEEEKPLKISVPTSGKIKPGTKLLMTSARRPVMVENSYGNGRVIWSGLNLPLHSMYSKNLDERLFFTKVFMDMFMTQPFDQPTYSAHSIEPEILSFQFDGIANGIIFPGETRDGWTVTHGKRAEETELGWLVFADGSQGLYIDPTDVVRYENGTHEYTFNYVGKHSLHYYELKEDYWSPLLHPTNAKVIGVVADSYSYETFLRTIAMLNVNSKYLIPVRISDPVDSLTLEELEQFDALVLYGYTYKNQDRAWRMLEVWVKDGGKLFIDTGSTVPETDTVNLRYENGDLPQVFPMKETEQTTLGNEWELTFSDDPVLSKVRSEEFGDPVLDGEAWKFSVPKQDSLREDSDILVSFGNDPLLVRRKVGDGEVIWSGMNLPYHAMVHKSYDEGRLLVNILHSFVKLEKTKVPSGYEIERKSPQQAKITFSPARGVIFREQVYSWKAKMLSPYKQKLKIYPVGPTFHGYNFVFIPDDIEEDEVIVEFTYGKWNSTYVYAALSLMTLFFIVDYAVLDGVLIARRLRPYFKRSHKRVKKWWEKEDEY